MPKAPKVPSYLEAADELAGPLLRSADAWGAAQTAPGDLPTVFALARLRFAAQVVRELNFRVDQLALEARQAGAAEADVADARAGHSPPELRIDRDGPIGA